MRILIDTNIIMDFIVERPPFSDEAEKLISLCIEKDIPCSIAAHTIPNLFYILRKYLNDAERRDILLRICKMFTVVAINSDRLISALKKSEFKDFEDCLQVEIAEHFPADFIVTRNTKDFVNSTIPVIMPNNLIVKLTEQHQQN